MVITGLVLMYLTGWVLGYILFATSVDYMWKKYTGVTCPEICPLLILIYGFLTGLVLYKFGG